MADLKPVYLIWGNDDVRLDAWRGRVRSRAQSEGSATTLEVLKDDRLSVQATVEAIGALTLSVGRRYLLVDGIERWSDRDLEAVEAALGGMPADTVVVVISKGKEPARLVKAVRAMGGEVHHCDAPKSNAYPAWIAERARTLGLSLDREAAETLLALVGDNQQRLLRELEKLSIYAGEARGVSAEEITALTSSAVDARIYQLADALIAGDRSKALTIAEDLRRQEEDMMHVLFGLLRQLRNAQKAWAMVAVGKGVRDVQSALRVPGFVARKIVAQAREVDGERLERALDLLADLDYAIRGAGRLDPESSLTLMLAHAASRAEPARA
jgi:DNA polymerase-3 subunit delta